MDGAFFIDINKNISINNQRKIKQLNFFEKLSTLVLNYWQKRRLAEESTSLVTTQIYHEKVTLMTYLQDKYTLRLKNVGLF